MQTKEKIKKILFKTKFVLGVVLTVGFFVVHFSLAETSIADLPIQNISDSDTQDKIDELEKKAEVYREIIEIKQKQSQSLNNQISIMDSNIQQVEAQIESNKKKIDDFNTQIIRLQKLVAENNAKILQQKDLLSKMIQAYYEYSKQNPVNAFFERTSLSSFMVQKDRLAQTSDKMNDLLKSITDLKVKKETEIASLEEKKKKIVDLHYTLEGQTVDLENIKISKKNLLDQTKGEEVRYNKLLERVEQQKLELLNIDELSLAGGLSADAYEKPPADSFAPLSWYYSQKDSRWGDSKIGNSKSLMKDYGCAVTSVAMILAMHGSSSVTPKTLAKQPIFSWDLIAWPQTWSFSNLTLSSNGFGHGNLSWNIIDSEIKKGNPVIVYINKSGGKGGHYVVVHHKTTKGKYVVHDPYFGPNIYLDTSRALVGLMGTNTATSVNQMIIYK